MQQLARYVHESDQILTAWDAYSDKHTDPDGWPHAPEAYRRRAARRDADTWRAFTRVRSCAKELLATAEVQLQQLDATAVQSHWVWQLATLEEALDELNCLQQQWLERLAELPASAGPGTKEYDDTLTERNAEAWHYLNEWSNHGQVLLDVHTAARHAPQPLLTSAPAHVPAPPAAAAKTSSARR